MVVFKHAEDVDRLLSKEGALLLQGRVNKQAEKTLKFTENPFLAKARVDFIASDEEETPEER